MTMTADALHTETAAVIAAAGEPDEATFSTLVERHRRPLHVHCYRMLGSFDEAEDVVQETLFRAWRARSTFDGRSSFRTWLYRIATNACLDELDRRKRRPRSVRFEDGSSAAGPSAAEVAWLQPYPDRYLEPVARSIDEPEAVAIARETIELAFIIALQHLPHRQRAVLIARDVLDLSAGDTAMVLDLTVAAVNSALQRARAALRRHWPKHDTDRADITEPTAEEREIVRRNIEASVRLDMDALGALLHPHARHVMPPEPDVAHGRAELMRNWSPLMVGPNAWGEWRYLETAANHQPAVAAYLRRPGEAVYR